MVKCCSMVRSGAVVDEVGGCFRLCCMRFASNTVTLESSISYFAKDGGIFQYNTQIILCALSDSLGVAVIITNNL